MARRSVLRLAADGGQPVIEEGEYRRWPEVTDADRAAVMRVLDSGRLWGLHQPETAALEEEVAGFCGTRHALLTNSGTAALHCMLVGVGVGPGDEVIVPAMTFHASAQVVLHAGARPVFVDVDPVTYNLTPAAVAAAITPRTRAIMAVHLHGLPADMDGLTEVAGRAGVALVGDAAQAPGARLRGRRVCALGDGAGISCNGSKPLAGMEAGLYVVDDDGAHEAGRRLAVFGERTPRPGPGEVRANWAEGVGYMYRSNEVVAAFVRSQLVRLPEYLARARANAALLAEELRGLAGVVVAEAPAGYESDWYRCRIRFEPERLGWDGSAVELRDRLLWHLTAEGAVCSTWQTRPVPAEPAFRQRSPRAWWPGQPAVALEPWEAGRYPVATRALQETLCVGSLDVMLHNQEEGLIRRYARAVAKVVANLGRVRRLPYEPLREVPEVSAVARRCGGDYGR
jgi:dTDP-4-amino-4,6-dideoxygalactose transaminase